MTTFATLKTRVQRRVIDLPTAVQAEVGDLVNDAVKAIQRRHNFRAMEAFGLYLTTTGASSLGSEVYFKEYKDKGPFLQYRNSRSKQLVTADTPDIHQAIRYITIADDVGEPEFVYSSVIPETGATSFNVAPYPDGNGDWDDDGNYRIVIPYYKYTAPLVNDGDTNWFVLNTHEYIINKATAEAFQLNWDYDATAVWLQRAEEKAKEVIRADKLQRLASVDALVPMHQGARQPQVRR